MELQDFLEKYANDNTDIIKWKGTAAVYPEWRKHFPEALAKHDNLICQKQRENCVEHCINEFGGDYNDSLYICIKDTPQPKIEEI